MTRALALMVALHGALVFAASPLSAAEVRGLADRSGRPYLDALLRNKGSVDPADSFEEKRLFTDELGSVHLHVRQTHGGVPVWGAEAIVHLNRDGSVNGITDGFQAKVNPQHIG